MAKEKMVYQANPLIEGRREFDVMETRLFYLGLRGVVPKLTNKDTVWTAREGFADDFPTVTIPTRELIELFGNDKYYSTLEDICDKLAKKTVKARTIDKDGNKSFSVYPVFAELSYNSKDGLIIEFNSKMKPWLLDLADKPFTKIPFEQVWQLSFQKKESHAIRLFELLLQYQNTKSHERTLTIAELKQYLGIAEEAYSGRTDNFRRFIIEENVKAINKATAYKVEYEPVKEGRKIVAFRFKIHLPSELAKERRKQQIEQIGNITKGHQQGMENIGSILKSTLSDSQKQKEVKSDKMTITAQKLTPKIDFQEQKPQLPLSEQPLSDLEFEMLKAKGFDGNNFNMENVKDRCLLAHVVTRGLTLADVKAGKR